MLSLPKPRRKPSSRNPFRSPPWDEGHPALRRIDAALPSDHHARWLARVVARLDLTALRHSYAGSGSRAYPVELLLPFVLWMYSQGRLSPADWVEQARYDDPSKWLLRGLQPSRSRLYAFRDRVEPFLDDWHQQLITWAVLEGITTARRGSLDGSFVAALASRHRLLSGRRLDHRLLLLRRLVWFDSFHDPADPAGLAARLQRLPSLLLLTAALALGLLPADAAAAVPLLEMLGDLLTLAQLLSPPQTPTWQPQVPAWVPPSVAGRRRVLQRYERAQQRLAQRQQPYQHKKKLSKKDRQTLKHLKVSPTDPEAALGWDKLGTYRPLYNVPLLQATDAPLTLAWDVLPQSHDEGLLRPMLEKAQGHLGRHLAEVLVDGAFVSVGDVAWCEGEGITVYAPPRPEEAAAAGPPSAAAQGAAAPTPGAEPGPAVAPSGRPRVAPRPKQLPKEAFRYDAAEGVYSCPQGKRLEELTRTKEKRKGGLQLPVIVYRASGQDCLACPQHSGCTSNPKQGRRVKRYEGEEALERLHQRMAEPAAQQVYKQRGQTVELGYADIKEHRGLRVFRCFGQKRARAQAGLVILASNGLKIVQALQRRLNTPQTPASEVKQPA